MTKHMTGTRIERSQHGWSCSRFGCISPAPVQHRRGNRYACRWANTLDALEVFVAQQPLW